MKQKTLYSLFCFTILFSMLLASCASGQAVKTVVVTEVVKEVVAGTPVEKIVEIVVTPTPVPPTEAPPTAEPKPVDTLVLALQQEPDTLHPLLGSMQARYYVQNLIYVGCMSQNEKAEWVPLGCEQVPTIENGGAKIVGEGEERHLEATYKIRDDWRWTDGTPVTSKDALFWWKMSMDPALEYENRPPYLKIFEMTALDDKTVLVKYMTAAQVRQAVAGTLTGQVDFKAFQEDYKASYPADWKNFAVDPVFWYAFGWLPEHILKDVPASEMESSEYARAPLGDGPYVMKEWKAGQEIILEASELPFPLGNPQIKTVVYRLFGDAAGVLAALQNGEVDMALGNPSGLTESNAPDLEALEKGGRYVTTWLPQYAYEHIDLNTTKFPLDDVKVRQALAYGVNRQELSDTLYYGKKIITDLPQPKGLAWAYPPDEKLTIYDYNPDKAKALLKEAGWDCSTYPCTKTVDGKTVNLEFTLMTTDRTDRQRLAQVVQQRWRELNVGVNLQFLYGRGLFATCDSNGPLNCRTFDAAIYTFSSDDSATFATTYGCGAIPNEKNNFSGQNYPGWCNTVANDALNESENNPEIAISREKRLPYLETYFSEMTKDIPVIFLYGAADPYPHLVNWNNFKPGPTQYSLPTWNAWEWEVSK